MISGSYLGRILVRNISCSNIYFVVFKFNKRMRTPILIDTKIG